MTRIHDTAEQNEGHILLTQIKFDGLPNTNDGECGEGASVCKCAIRYAFIRHIGKRQHSFIRHEDNNNIKQPVIGRLSYLVLANNRSPGPC